MNYKIKVESEAVSKEVQELFFELGYGWRGVNPRNSIFIPKKLKEYFIINYEKTKDMQLSGVFDNSETLKTHKEITLPQLRDLVVLKRNSIDDATHACDYPSGLGVNLSGEWYVYNYNEEKWELWGNDPEYKVGGLKPITKEEGVKEYLNKDTYEFVQSSSELNDMWIEIPDGAMFATGSDVIFSKNNYIFDNGEWRITNVTIGNANYCGLDIVWQREPIDKNEQVLKEILEGGQDNVNQPSHYCSHPSGIECIEITRHHDFAIGNAIKYLWRAGLKDSANEIQDLEKAAWYIQDKINQLKK